MAKNTPPPMSMEDMNDLLDKQEGAEAETQVEEPKPKPKTVSQIKTEQQVASGKPQPVGEYDDKQAAQEEFGGTSNTDPANTGYPNPLLISLTECHLPIEFVRDKATLLKYVGMYFSTSDTKRIVPTKNETELYAKYLQLSKRYTRLPTLPRVFSCAVRCISAGHPLQHSKKPDIDSMGL